ncbi:PssD/Cps14F family polysaccharide biosynthesis glycosyltransferase [Shewanella frigidimarina]|uniref:PssD/Cps14F family polysaccharide biosynthesis glycosyltransferase n=1 Tax=Shewanella frigidimarina TaxID=56812 RepID=UPI003D7A2793
MHEKVILVIYGRGGHKEQMRRLLNELKKNSPNLQFVSIADVEDQFGSLLHYKCPEPRDKFNVWSAPFKIPYSALITLIQCIRLSFKHEISGIVSTGPGMAVLPSILFRLLSKQVIYIESWSRFYSGSLTGRFMYYIANVFYVQNKSMLAIFPKAKYSGRL